MAFLDGVVKQEYDKNFFRNSFINYKFVYDEYKKCVMTTAGERFLDCGNWLSRGDYLNSDVKGRFIAKLLNDERVKQIIFDELPLIDEPEIEPIPEAVPDMNIPQEVEPIEPIAESELDAPSVPNPDDTYDSIEKQEKVLVQKKKLGRPKGSKNK